jgi:hypothetical protein
MVKKEIKIDNRNTESVSLIVIKINDMNRQKRES